MQRQRIPPSEQIRQQVYRLLDEGLEHQEDLVGTLIELGAQLLVQEALEKETTERLRRAHYQHRKPPEPLGGYRDSYESACL